VFGPRKPRRRTEPGLKQPRAYQQDFAIVDLPWFRAAIKALAGQGVTAAAVPLLIQYRFVLGGRRHELPIVLGNKALRQWGVTRPVKQRALDRLAEDKLIRLEVQTRKSPVVFVLPFNPRS
jgi:hypothetical protein